MKKSNILLLSVLFLLAATLLSGCTGGASNISNAASWPGLAADENAVYIAYNNSIQAIEAGKLLWRYPADSESKVMFYASPLVDEQYIYAGSYSNQLHVINKSNGSLVQTVDLPNAKLKIIASPILADGKIIITSSNGSVTALDAKSYKSLWSTSLSGEAWTTPLFLNGKIYIPSMDNKINELDAVTGEISKTWEVSGALMSKLVESNGQLFFSTLSKEVNELDILNGSTKTLLSTDGELWAAPLIVEDKMIIGDMAGNIYCNANADGSPIWKLEKVTKDNAGFIASAVMTGEDSFVIAAENGELFAYDMAGKAIQNRAADQKLYTTPITSGDGVVAAFIPGEPLIRAYSADLKEDWIYTPVVPEKEGE